MGYFGSARNGLRLFFLASLAVTGSLSVAQTGLQAAAASEPPHTVLKTGVRLVAVDVTVRDSQGHPVTGLSRNDFRITEDARPQMLRAFEEHAPSVAPPRPPLPPLPAGTFTNYTPVPVGATLNVLLIDALNTPLSDQSYLHSQLQAYVKSAPADQPIAIFGLNSRLFLLQGFTSDPAVLKDAVTHKLVPRGSDLLEEPNGTNTQPTPSSEQMQDLGPGLEQLVASMQQFEAQSAAAQVQLRAQETLDALNAIAHYLGNFPGRKNLLWFSGSFPINIQPDPSIQNGFAVLGLNEREFRETTDLLARAQVAVYPVDARGAIGQPMYDASNTGRKYTQNPGAFGKDLDKFNASQAAEHTTMDQMAAETGGHAYYGTNDLAGAVRNAVTSGSSFYALAYSPSNKNAHGEYRAIHVELTGAAAARGLTLVYRKGYYAEDSARSGPAVETSTAGGVDPVTQAAAAYGRVVMSHGAPTPQDVLFKVRVIPVSNEAEQKLAPGNQAGHGAVVRGPYRRYAVDYAAAPSDFTFALQPNGRHTGEIAFKAFVFDTEGNLLTTAGNMVHLDLTQPHYDRLLETAVEMHLEVSVPVACQCSVRLGVQDVTSNRYGVVEIPVDRVRNLPAAEAGPTMSAGKAR